MIKKNSTMLLFISLLLVSTGAGVSARGGQEESAATGSVSSGAVRTGEYGESPVLAELVQKGELSAVDERLPENPLVLEVVEEIGQYGGTWRGAWRGPSDKWAVGKIAPEYLIRWNSDATKLIPNLAESWDTLDNGARYVFHLRKGLKWSDGVPFTTDDILFFWEHHLLNKEINAQLNSWWFLDGQKPDIEKIDDYTFSITYQKPYPLFLPFFVTEQKEFFLPVHYMKQFHPDFTPKDELDKMVKEAGLENWTQLYKNKGGKYPFIRVGCPSMRAWYPAELLPSRFISERNPYFWKVDPEGNQLPYIDRITFDLCSDKDILNAKAMAGELDCQYRDISKKNYTLFKENEKQGDFRVLKWTRPGYGGDSAIQMNQTVKDPELRKLFQDVRFRKALSLAINREEILEVLYKGVGEVRQASIVSGAAFYSEEWEKAYIEYDPAKSNAILDELGLKWDAKHEFRLRSDGQTLTVLFEGRETEPSDYQLLIKEYWQAVGVKVLIRNYERSLYEQKLNGNDLQISTWGFGSLNFILDPRQIVPIKPGTEWSNQYALWYETGGTAGEKPTGDIAKIIEIWEELKVTVDENKRNKLAEEIVKLHAKNIWVIAAVGERPGIAIVKNRIRNVPEVMIADDMLRDVGNANPPQFFIKK